MSHLMEIEEETNLEKLIEDLDIDIEKTATIINQENEDKILGNLENFRILKIFEISSMNENKTDIVFKLRLLETPGEFEWTTDVRGEVARRIQYFDVTLETFAQKQKENREQLAKNQPKEVVSITQTKLEGTDLIVRNVPADIIKNKEDTIRNKLESKLKVKINSVQKVEPKGNTAIDYVFINLETEDAEKIVNKTTKSMEVDYRVDYSDRDHARTVMIKSRGPSNGKPTDQIRDLIIKAIDKQANIDMNRKDIIIFSPKNAKDNFFGIIHAKKKEFAQRIKNVEIEDDGLIFELYMTPKRTPKSHTELAISSVPRKFTGTRVEGLRKEITDKTGIRLSYIDVITDNNKATAYIGTYSAKDSERLLTTLKQIGEHEVTIRRTIDANEPETKKLDITTRRSESQANIDTAIQSIMMMNNTIMDLARKQTEQMDRFLQLQEQQTRVQERQASIQEEYAKQNNNMMNSMLTLLSAQQERDRQKEAQREEYEKRQEEKINKLMEAVMIQEAITGRKRNHEDDKEQKQSKFPRVNSANPNKNNSMYHRTFITMTLLLLISGAQASNTNNGEAKQITIGAINVMCLTSMIIMNKLVRWLQDCSPDILIITEHKIRRIRNKVSTINIPGYEWRSISANPKRIKRKLNHARGGVAILTKPEIITVEPKNHDNEEITAGRYCELAIIKQNNEKIRIIGAYGPADQRHQKEYWNRMTEIIKTTTDKIIIGGDFNNLTRKEDATRTTNHKIKEMRLMMDRCHLEEIDNNPNLLERVTFIRNEYASKIDHFLTNFRDGIIKSETIDAEIADHRPLLLTLLPDLVTGEEITENKKNRTKIDQRNKTKVAEYQNSINNWLYQNEQTIEEFRLSKKNKGEEMYGLFNEIVVTTAKRTFTVSNRYQKRTERVFPYDSKGGRLIGRLSWINRAIRRITLINQPNKEQITLSEQDLKALTPNELTEDITEIDTNVLTQEQINKYLKQLKNKRNTTAKKLTSEIKRTREQRTKEWQELIRNEGHANSSKIRHILNKTDQVQLKAVTNNNGELITNPESIKETIATYFSEQRQSANVNNTTKPWLSHEIWADTKEKIAQYNRHNSLEKDITLDELRTHLRERPNGKSSGIDEVTYEMIKILPTDALKLYIDILNTIINEKLSPKNFKSAEIVLIHKRDSPYETKNYRPITLLEIAYKLITGIIADRLSRMNQQIRFITPCQFGGIINTSCGEATQVIINVIKKAKREKKELHVGCHDVSGAYDNEPREGVIDTFTALGLPNILIERIVFLQDKLANKIRTVYGHTKEIEFNKGIPQGDPFSVLKFVLFMDMFSRWTISLERGYKINNTTIPGVQWIDDSNFIAKSRQELQEMTNDLIKFLSAYQMKLSPAKSSYMAFNQNDANAHINVEQTIVRATKQIRFLGYHIDSELNFEDHERKIKFAMHNSLGKITKHNLPAENKINLINSDTISIFRFSADIIPYSDKFIREMTNKIKRKADPTNHYRIAAIMYQIDKKLFAHHIDNLDAINKGRMVSNLFKCLNNKNPFVKLTTENTINDMNDAYKTQVLDGVKIINNAKARKFPANITQAINILQKLEIKTFINRPVTKTIEQLTIEEYVNEIQLTTDQRKTMNELGKTKTTKMSEVYDLFKPQQRGISKINRIIAGNTNELPNGTVKIQNAAKIVPIFTEVYTKAFARLKRFTAATNLNLPRNNDTWATDGSKRGEIATLAIVSNNRTYQFRVPEIQSINRAEALAIQVCLEMNSQNNDEIKIISDSKTTIQLIEKYRKTRKEKVLRGNDSASIIKRIAEIIDDKANVSIKHVKAHTGKRDPESILNDKADKAAKQTNDNQYPAPISWKHLPEYIPLTNNILFEGNLSKEIRKRIQERIFQESQGVSSIRSFISERVWTAPSFFSTGRNQNDLNFAIQCTAKGLPTLALLAKRSTNVILTNQCPACEEDIEDQEHVMLRCDKYQQIRQELTDELKNELRTEEDKYIWLKPTKENQFFPGKLACRGAIPAQLERVISLRKAKRINDLIIQHFKRIWKERNEIIVEKGLTYEVQRLERLREQYDNIYEAEEEVRRALERQYIDQI